ncbi:lipoprotein [Spiroplasma endosymbiont of Polydrusus pterygomalis]|uniref:lipoprotein n=1 Tax=Spiroplasma endosymbiont of Polydrusus pterygomalis TaxID=3139327 RepID=UPI003CCAC9A9
MKKILSLLGVITLIGTSTLGIVSCGQEPKCENKIIGNLKEICSSNKPFHKDDNKWYFVIARGENIKWNIIKFQNNNKSKDIYTSNNYYINLSTGSRYYSGLVLWIKKDDKKFSHTWGQDKGEYFKNVYQWLGENESINNDIPKIDENGNIIV